MSWVLICTGRWFGSNYPVEQEKPHTSVLQSGSKEFFSSRDPSVSKSIERIFKIWEDRNVYPEETILALKEALSKLLTLCISHLTINRHVSSLKL